MATITIAADGSGSHLAPNASAYAALATGSTANTVNWKAGVYVPEAGKWWGLAGDYHHALDKRTTHQVTGGGEVVLDGRVFVPTGVSPYVVWHASGTWRIELFTTNGGGSIDEMLGVWFGAETGSTAGDIVVGASYKMAASLAQVNSSGLTVSGMASGNGIWYTAIESSTVHAGKQARVIYVWCPLGQAQRPAEQWGGIASVGTMRGSTLGGGCPYLGAFCYSRNTTTSNDPSGSYVGPGFIVVGAGRHLLGSSLHSDADNSRPVSDIEYDGVAMLAPGKDGLRLASNGTSTIYSSWRLGGDWSFDDGRDPLTEPEFIDQNNRSAVYVGARVTGLEVDGGTCTTGNTHGVVEVSGGDSGEARPSNCSFIGIAATARLGVNDARWANINNGDNCTFARWTVRGYCTRAQIGGTGTLFHGINLAEWKRSTIDSNNNIAPFRIRTASDAVPSAVTVKLYANVVDLRDTDSTTYAAFDFITAGGGGNIPAGCIDGRDNVTLLRSSGQAVFRAQNQGGSWSTNQQWRGGHTSGAVQAYDGGSTRTPAGTSRTFAQLFSTGTTSAPTSATNASILARGDVAIMRVAPEAAAASAA